LRCAGTCNAEETQQTRRYRGIKSKRREDKMKGMWKWIEMEQVKKKHKID
jgi:hypothetical protein